MNDERRHQPDRRRHPRGGRRTADRQGHSPLVMLVDADNRRRERSEAVLIARRFAVAPIDSVEKAIKIAQALRPSVIVCSPDHAAQIRERLAIAVPIVEFGDGATVTDALIDRVRSALRSET